MRCASKIPAISDASAALEDRVPSLDEGGDAFGCVLAVGEPLLGLPELGDVRPVRSFTLVAKGACHR
jgi:hypothetical protein